MGARPRKRRRPPRGPSTLIPTRPVLSLFRRCHAALARTRGAALAVASLDARSNALTWAAVGNVVGVLVRAKPVGTSRREVVSMRGGVVGSALPTLRSATLPVAPGDLLALASDGIHDGFDTELVSTASAQSLADRILERYGRGTDDALVLVARYLGGPL